MSKVKEFEFGTLVRDTITGYEGIVFAKTDYMNGNRIYGMSSQTSDKTKQTSIEWVSDFYLEEVCPAK